MHTTIQQKISTARPGESASRPAETPRPHFGNLLQHLQLTLVTTRCGRIALHLLVALQTGHYLWHWRGIARELGHW